MEDPTPKSRLRIKERASTVRKHVVDRRGRYAFIAGSALTFVALHKLDRVSDWNAFLEEKGLMEEFYTPEAVLENVA